MPPTKGRSRIAAVQNYHETVVTDNDPSSCVVTLSRIRFKHVRAVNGAVSTAGLIPALDGLGSVSRMPRWSVSF